MSDANYIFTLVWPMFFSYCGLLGWNVVGSGTLRVSGKNSQVCSQPKRESLGPAKMPHEFPDLPGRQPRAQEDVPSFWMRPMCSLHCSGNHPLTGPHGGIHPTGLELAKPHLDRRGTELVAQFTKHNTNIIIIHRTDRLVNTERGRTLLSKSVVALAALGRP